jgi:hypothetical protein
MSAMEEVLRRAERHFENGNSRGSLLALVEAIKKLDKKLTDLECGRGRQAEAKPGDRPNV